MSTRVRKPVCFNHPCRDSLWRTTRSAASGRKGEVAQLATGGDAPNGIAIVLREPERAIRSRCDLLWSAANERVKVGYILKHRVILGNPQVQDREDADSRHDEQGNGIYPSGDAALDAWTVAVFRDLASRFAAVGDARRSWDVRGSDGKGSERERECPMGGLRGGKSPVTWPTQARNVRPQSGHARLLSHHEEQAAAAPWRGLLP